MVKNRMADAEEKVVRQLRFITGRLQGQTGLCAIKKLYRNGVEVG